MVETEPILSFVSSIEVTVHPVSNANRSERICSKPSPWESPTVTVGRSRLVVRSTGTIVKAPEYT